MAGKPMFFTIRKHWKKSIFAACVSIFGTYYASGRFREYLVRRELCSEAKKIGQEPIEALKKPRRMYVFLNPTANKGGAMKLYERNVAPILHLAAVDVTLIKTDYEGHAKSLMGYIDPTIDGIIVAGGDGTLMEVVTGLIRLQDQDTISKIPLGFVPLGRTNSFFRKINKNATQNARTLGKATMAIVKGNTKQVEVMEIASEGVRPTYALSSLCWGVFQEAKTRIDAKKHWWAGPWKKQMAFIARTVKNWPHLYSASLFINGFNDEISINKDIETEIKAESKEGSVSVDNENGYEETVLDKDMDELTKTKVSAREMTGVQLQLNDLVEESKLEMQIWNSDMSRTEFISNGINWIENNYSIINSENCQKMHVDQLKLVPNMNEVTWFHIDGEEFEAKTVEIKIHRSKLRFFH